MRNLRQLTPADVLFVGGETDRVYQHTAGLVLLDASDHPDFGYDSFRRHLEGRLKHIPHFRWKLHQVPLGLDLPYWVEDDKFSFDNHIRRIAVPSPGDDKALGELVSYLYSRHMDRNRPLWEAWFIEGLSGGRYALFQKLHHCLMDGEGAARLGAAISDFAPDAKPRPVDPSISEARPGEIPELWWKSVVAAGRLSQLPFKLGAEAYDVLRDGIRKRLSRSADHPGRPSFPLAMFNGDIGSQRGFVFGSLPLAEIKALKNHFDVTVNDVLLAMVSRSLRNYLLHMNELPEESLRTFMAISLREEKDESFTNRVTTVSATLATDLSDPLQCLQVIAADTEAVKRRARAGAKGVMELIQILPPFMFNVIFRAAPAEQIAAACGANLLVSNVRGSSVPMYVGGARMTAMYPMSILTPGGGLNVTCISYTDEMDIGVTVDPDLFPNAWLFVDGLKKAHAEYMALMRKGARHPARSKAKASATARPRATARAKRKATAAAKRKATATAKPKAAAAKRKATAPVKPKAAAPAKPKATAGAKPKAAAAAKPEAATRARPKATSRAMPKVAARPGQGPAVRPKSRAGAGAGQAATDS